MEGWEDGRMGGEMPECASTMFRGHCDSLLKTTEYFLMKLCCLHPDVISHRS
jgi:hypothetical protein